MKQFSCGDVIPGCPAHFLGETDDSILRQVAAHAARDHGVASLSPELVEQVVALVRPA